MSRAGRGARQTVPTAAVELVEEPWHAEDVLRRGEADAVLLGRAMLRDPHGARHAAVVLGDPSGARSGRRGLGRPGVDRTRERAAARSRPARAAARQPRR